MKKILAVQPKIFVTGEPKHPVTPWRPSCHTDLGKWEVMGDFTTRWLSARGCKCVTGNREWGSPALTPQGCPRADWMKMVRMSGILQLFNSKSTKITHIPWFRQIVIKSNQYTNHSFTAYIHLVTQNGHNMNGLNILMQPKRIVSSEISQGHKFRPYTLLWLSHFGCPRFPPITALITQYLSSNFHSNWMVVMWIKNVLFLATKLTTR